MALATADASGRPSVRIVLLKGFDEPARCSTPTTTPARDASWPRTPGLGRDALAPAAASGPDRGDGRPRRPLRSPTPTSPHVRGRADRRRRLAAVPAVQSRAALEAQVADAERISTAATSSVRSTGAATAWPSTRWSSGKAGRTASTTDSVSPAPATAGRWSVSSPRHTHIPWISVGNGPNLGAAGLHFEVSGSEGAIMANPLGRTATSPRANLSLGLGIAATVAMRSSPWSPTGTATSTAGCGSSWRCSRWARW